MHKGEAKDAAASDMLFYRLLAGLLTAGVIVAIILGLGGVGGPGWFELESGIVALFAMTIFMWLVLLVFLLRVRVFFDIEDRANDIINREAQRLQEAFGRQETNWNQMKEGIKQDLLDFRGQVRKDIAERDGRISDALTLAGEARRIAMEVEKGRQVIQKAQNEMAPAIMVLQEQVAALQKETKGLNIRLAETLETLERREMESAAALSKAELEFSNLKRREALLLVKTKELEEVASAAEARPIVKLTEKDEREHVLNIEGIGTKYAARLNAIGIISIRQLLAANPAEIAPKIDATPELVKEWQAMGNLMQLRGVGPQFAEVLVAAGIHTVDQLSTSEPLPLAQKIEGMESSRKTRLQGTKVTEGLVNRWVQAARSRDYV